MQVTRGRAMKWRLGACVLALAGALVPWAAVQGHWELSFSPGGTFPVGLLPARIVAADLNGDGRIDLVTVNSSSHDLSVLLNTPGPGFAPQVVIPAGGTSPHDLVVADFDRDGKPDIATANAKTHAPSRRLA